MSASSSPLSDSAHIRGGQNPDITDGFSMGRALPGVQAASVRGKKNEVAVGALRRANHRHAWDDSESDLLVALRARNLSYSMIRDRHFPHWSAVGMSYKFRKLMKQSRWELKHEEILNMEDSDQLAFIDRASAAVALRRRQQASQRQDREAGGGVARNRALLDETGGDQPVDGDLVVGDAPDTSHINEPLHGGRIDENIHGTTESTGGKKRNLGGRRDNRQKRPWDDEESEMVVALRAAGLTYTALSEGDFKGWSRVGIRNKFLRLTENEPRWKARFEAIQRMDEYEQLATIAFAQGAVAQSRSRRAHAEREDEDADDAENPVSENAVENPDPETARTTPAEKDDNQSLNDESEDESDSDPVDNHHDNGRDSDTPELRPPRVRRIPARYRDR